MFYFKSGQDKLTPINGHLVCDVFWEKQSGALMFRSGKRQLLNKYGDEKWEFPEMSSVKNAEQLCSFLQFALEFAGKSSTAVYVLEDNLEHARLGLRVTL